MSDVVMGPHPDFDALSAYSDLDDAAALRARVARHVAQCSRCLAEVAAIRALGDAARALPVEGAGSELWERIRSASAADRVLDPQSIEVRGAGSLESDHPRRSGAHERAPVVRRWYSSRVWLLGSAAALVAVAGIALLATRRSLDASDASRLTFTPSRPVPGGSMTVRYRPAPYLAGAPKLVLAGRFAKPDDAYRNRYFVEARDGLDSLATLHPAGDGSYEAHLRLPDDFLAVRMMVFDSAGDASDRDGDESWVAIGGRRDHSPSLEAFIAGYSSAHRRERSRQRVSVADSIQRYFPGHPAGWALYEHYGEIKGVLDLFRFFETAEKKYASLDTALWSRPSLDAEQSWAMASLAQKISEPAEEAKWARRLAREHPDDPRAFRALAGMVHAIELRDPPHVVDSVRPWLPVLDSLYLRSRPTLDPYSNEMLLFQRQGDSVQKAGWRRRFAQPRSFFTRASLPAKADAKTESDVRRILAAGCAKPSGRFPLPDVSAWYRWCAFDHSLLWNYLAEAHLSRGDATGAETLADSGIAAVAGRCADRLSLRIRGDAKLARGDTTGAARDYAREFGRWSVDREIRTRAIARLGARFDSSAFESAADSARRESVGCLRRQKLDDSTRTAHRGKL